MPDTGWKAIKQFKEAALKYFTHHLPPRKPQHQKDSLKFFSFFFFKHYSQFQRHPKEEIATKWDIKKEKKKKASTLYGRTQMYYSS